MEHESPNQREEWHYGVNKRLSELALAMLAYFPTPTNLEPPAALKQLQDEYADLTKQKMLHDAGRDMGDYFFTG